MLVDEQDVPDGLVGFKSETSSIRKLAEEATLFCIKGHFKAPWTWEDKFAELIIRKCASIVPADTEDYILEYFGIECQD